MLHFVLLFLYWLEACIEERESDTVEKNASECSKGTCRGLNINQLFISLEFSFCTYFAIVGCVFSRVCASSERFFSTEF